MHTINPGIAICTPMPMVMEAAGPRLAPITVEWHRARRNLGVPTNIGVLEICCDGMEVGEARSEAVRLLLGAKRIPSCLFFLDYDVIPQHDALVKLYYRLKTWHHDIVCGVYTVKSEVGEPLIYKSWFDGPCWDWTIGDLITEGIIGCHMGLTLIRTELLARMHEGEGGENLFKTIRNQTFENGAIQNESGSEDLYFCKLAREKYGAEILVDGGVIAGHQDIGSGRVYGLPNDSPPAKRAGWMKPKPRGEKHALDLGAGSLRRQWPGHRTFTTDVRADVSPDYVQDTRKLTLPNDRFDLVASSHHLEHLGRWDQETVWSEMFRITKPGGKIEHIVPSLEWAAEKVSTGHVDEHVMNVLWGAQEEHGYAREWNTHYFGYTKEIARALAEAAGFRNVETRDWRDDPELGYNLLITGEKPCRGKSGTTTEPRTRRTTATRKRHRRTECSVSSNGTPTGRGPFTRGATITDGLARRGRRAGKRT